METFFIPLTFLTPVTIISATVAGYLIGFLWYSPALFMKAWMRGEGITQDHMPKRSMMYLIQVNIYSVIAHGAMATVLAVLFSLLGVATQQAALSLGLLLAFGFIVTTRFIDMVYTPQGKHYEAKSQIKFLVGAGYYLVAIAVMSAVLFAVSHR